MMKKHRADPALLQIPAVHLLLPAVLHLLLPAVLPPLLPLARRLPAPHLPLVTAAKIVKLVTKIVR